MQVFHHIGVGSGSGGEDQWKLILMLWSVSALAQTGLDGLGMRHLTSDYLVVVWGLNK